MKPSKIAPITPQHVDETVSLSSGGGDKKEIKERPALLKCVLSIRIFLTVSIMFVVLLTSISIWVSAYKVNESTALEAVSVLVLDINEKISSFVVDKLETAKRVSFAVAADFHNGYLDFNLDSRKYLISKVNGFNVSVVAIVRGEEGANELYGFSRDDTHPVPFVWAVKPQNGTLQMWGLDAEGEIEPWVPSTKYPGYSIPKESYYRESMDKIFPSHPEGAFGSVYLVIDSNLQTYWPNPLYDRVLMKNGTKKIIGLTKTNLSLEGIQNYLQKVKVLERGYLIMCEMDTSYVIGGSITLPNLRAVRVPITNITTRGAGKVMGKLLEAHKNSGEVSLVTSIEQDGINYLVSSSPLEYHGIRWRMILVFEESEIKKGIIFSSYVILGVSLFVCVMGIAISIGIGWIVTNPLFNLEKDFKKIDVLDLDNVKKRVSVFTEVDKIYKKLSKTVDWLAEFRAFLPSNVLNNLQEEKHQADSKQVEHKYMQDDYKMEQLKSSMSNDKFYESMSTIHQKHSKNMFAIGLNAKDSCVLSIKVKPSCLDMNDPVAVSDRTSRILIGISTISNTIKVDLQINSYDKFTLVIVDKFNNTLLGMDTALRIITTLNRLNAQYEKNGETPFEICIGVASGQCLQGNIGNKSVRYFSNIGEVVKRADDMCTMSYILDVPIIVDNQSMKLSQNSFVFKPVDRYASESKVETIFELVKSSHVENDEWLYELEQKKQNAKFAQLNECFKRLFECNETLDETEVRAARQQMIDIGADDRIIGRFVELLDKVQDSKDLESLRSCVRTRIESMLQNCELVVI